MSHPFFRKFSTSALLLLLLIASYPLGRLFVFAFSSADPETTESKYVLVNKGQAPKDIIKLLFSAGIIKKQNDFMWLGRISRQWKRIKAGEYQLSASMTPIEIFSILTSGISVSHPVTVREGENIYEIADNLLAKRLIESKESFLKLCSNPEFIFSSGYFTKDQIPITLEGYLYPDTYFFDHTQSPADIAKQMLRHFFSSWGKTEEDRLKQLNMTRHEIITLASMIEKETGASEERALISSVFHNRLKKGMRLQSDPTTIYGMWEKFHGKIHKRDLAAKNSYNTYFVNALPIGPIGNPGQESIHAALYPATTDFYYFVSHNNGTHQFSKTIEEHNRAVRKYQLDPKAREGKSWRDHLKKPQF